MAILGCPLSTKIHTQTVPGSHRALPGDLGGGRGEPRSAPTSWTAPTSGSRVGKGVKKTSRPPSKGQMRNVFDKVALSAAAINFVSRGARPASAPAKHAQRACARAQSAQPRPAAAGGAGDDSWLARPWPSHSQKAAALPRHASAARPSRAAPENATTPSKQRACAAQPRPKLK